MTPEARAFFAELRPHYGRQYNDGTGMGYRGRGHWDNVQRWSRSADGVLKAWQAFTDDAPLCSVLDLGCGRGVMTHHLREHGVSAVGLDITDDDMPPFCVQGNACEMPFAQPFDLIAGLDIVEHVPVDFQAILWAELRRLTGRLLFVTVPTRPPYHEYGAEYGVLNHYYSLSPVAWAMHFASHGFRVIGSGAEMASHGPPFSHGEDNFPFALRRAA